MRGKAGNSACGNVKVGITPAYAGKSGLYIDPTFEDKDHPRVCGEKLLMLVFWMACSGITPAYAGKSRFAKTGK